MTATMMTASDEDWSQLTWEEELYHGYPDHDDESNNDLVVDRVFTIDDDWMTGGAARPFKYHFGLVSLIEGRSNNNNSG